MIGRHAHGYARDQARAADRGIAVPDGLLPNDLVICLIAARYFMLVVRVEIDHERRVVHGGGTEVGDLGLNLDLLGARVESVLHVHLDDQVGPLHGYSQHLIA